MSLRSREDHRTDKKTESKKTGWREKCNDYPKLPSSPFPTAAASNGTIRQENRDNTKGHFLSKLVFS